MNPGLGAPAGGNVPQPRIPGDRPPALRPGEDAKLREELARATEELADLQMLVDTFGLAERMNPDAPPTVILAKQLVIVRAFIEECRRTPHLRDAGNLLAAVLDAVE